MEQDVLEAQARVSLEPEVSEPREARGAPGKEPRAVRRLREHIEEHYAEAITLQSMAELVSLSKFHMLRVFRGAVGLPPHAFLTRVRILHAQSLIAAGVSLTRVALDTGFSDQSHLIRHFKRATGLTPGAYARRCARDAVVAGECEAGRR